MLRTLRSAAFLVKAPIILVVLFFINLFTSPGEWWVQWAALGLGIAWVFALLRVLRAVLVAGGMAALGYYLFRRGQAPDVPPSRGERPVHPDIPTTPVSKT